MAARRHRPRGTRRRHGWLTADCGTKTEIDKRRQLQRELRTLLTTVELDDLRERVSERVLTTTVGPVAEHIYTYLSGLGVPNVSVEDINRWWRTPGRIAHGAPVDIEQGDLNRLITVFQTALRRTGGAEPSSASAT